MKTILIFVSTVDGKVTKWGHPFIRQWSSKEDQDHFDKIWNDSQVIIMGSNTFNADRFNPSPKHLIIIMTHNPAGYEKYYTPGQLEFTNESPPELIDRFTKEGHENLLVVGGPHAATSFLKENLIDELWLTLEPKIFGSGGSFVIEENLDINLRLLSFKKVNDQGTLITSYAVLK